MFFEGCLPHLGCSIKLRGASEYELARVKEIIMLMMCVAYHSQLEISFLMDEFAMPPSLPQSTSFPCLLEGTSVEEEADGEKRGKDMNGEGQEKYVKVEDSGLGGQPEEEGLPSEFSSKNGEVHTLQDKQTPKSSSSVEEEAANTETMTSPFRSPPAPPLSVPPPFLLKKTRRWIQTLSSEYLMGRLGKREP